MLNTAAQTQSQVRLHTQQQLPYRITYSIDGGAQQSNFLSSRLLADSASDFRLKQAEYVAASPDRRNESRQSITENKISLRVYSGSRKKELIQQDINEQQ